MCTKRGGGVRVGERLSPASVPNFFITIFRGSHSSSRGIVILRAERQRRKDSYYSLFIPFSLLSKINVSSL